jgi:hypothetical protein
LDLFSIVQSGLVLLFGAHELGLLRDGKRAHFNGCACV